MGESHCSGCRERDALIAKQGEQVAKLEERVRELEDRLNCNSSNSSTPPPSADPPGAPKRPPKHSTERKPGGQPGHTGHHRVRLPPERVNRVVPYLPEACERCGTGLAQEPGPDDPEPMWHQVAELPEVVAIVTEHQGHARTCPCCGHLTRAEIPPEVRAHAFGPKLTATVAFFSGCCHDSKRIIELIVETVLRMPMSLGTVANLEQEVSAALAEPYQQAEQAVRAAPAKNADETGWNLAGKLCWLWMATTQTVAFFKIYGGRGKAGLRALLGEMVVGVVSSDRWSAYNIVDLYMRQICWAHLKRDFQKWADRGTAIGQVGLEAARRLFCLWRDFRQGRIDRSALRAGLEPVCAELQAALEAGQLCADKKVARFCKNILGVYPALWTFARVEGVEPTNNRGERTLRPAVLWRKISFGTQSEAGCRFTERILSVVQSLRLQERHVLDYLREALVAHRSAQPAPVLVAMGQ